MTARLLDVNVLVALVDSAHVHHQSARQWFRAHVHEGWATCTITENGFVRVASGPAYPNLRFKPSAAAALLNDLKHAFAEAHQFWPDAVPLTDSALFDLRELTGSRQTTDAYLAGLAHHRGGRFATLDGSVQWRAVRGATQNLVEQIPS